MAIFSYRATTKEGVVVEGAIEAADEKAAVEMLRNAGVMPFSLAEPREGFMQRFSLRSSKGVFEARVCLDTPQLTDPCSL